MQQISGIPVAGPTFPATADPAATVGACTLVGSVAVSSTSEPAGSSGGPAILTTSEPVCSAVYGRRPTTTSTSGWMSIRNIPPIHDFPPGGRRGETSEHFGWVLKMREAAVAVCLSGAPSTVTFTVAGAALCSRTVEHVRWVALMTVAGARCIGL